MMFENLHDFIMGKIPTLMDSMPWLWLKCVVWK